MMSESQLYLVKFVDELQLLVYWILTLLISLLAGD